MGKIRLMLASLFMLLAVHANAQGLLNRFMNWVTGVETIEASDNIITKTVDLKAFDVLRLSGSIDVTYIQEEGTIHPRVVMTGPDNILEIIVVEQNGSTLKVHYKSNTNFRLNRKPLTVEVYSSDIRKISLSGSGDLEFGDLRVGDFDLTLSGSGDVEGGNIRSTGSVAVSISGSGDVEVKQVGCFDLTMSISGSGDMEVGEVNSESVKASIAGSGDIQLAGTTQKATYKVVGSGNIDARSLKAQEVSKSKAGSGSISY